MAECKALGCKNKKRKNKDKHYFAVPRPSNDVRKQLALQWLHNLGTGHTLTTFPFGSNSVVCQDHFTEDAFDSMKVRFYGGSSDRPTRLHLKPEAVPTLFAHRATPNPARGQRLDDRVAKQNKLVRFHVFCTMLVSFSHSATWSCLSKCICIIVLNSTEIEVNVIACIQVLESKK